MTRSDRPRPKLRVILRSSSPSCPHEAHKPLKEIDGDDKERPFRVEFDDRLCFKSFDCDTTDDEFDFAGLTVALALDDFTCEDDAFEVEDREVFIVELFCGMQGNSVRSENECNRGGG